MDHFEIFPFTFCEVMQIVDAMLVLFERQDVSKSPAEVIVVEPKLEMDELGAEHF